MHGAAGQWTCERFGQLKTELLRSLAVNKPGRTGEEIGAWHDAHEGRAEPEQGSLVAASGGNPSIAASPRHIGRGQTTIPQRQRRKHGSLSGQANGWRGGDALTPQRWPRHRPGSARNRAERQSSGPADVAGGRPVPTRAWHGVHATRPEVAAEQRARDQPTGPASARPLAPRDKERTHGQSNNSGQATTGARHQQCPTTRGDCGHWAERPKPA
jgi:hypothetical protein